MPLLQHDITFYFETLPSNELELALYLESERMLHAKVDETGVETSREIVKEERRQGLKIGLMALFCRKP